MLGGLNDRQCKPSRLQSGTLGRNVARTIFKSWFVDFDPVRAKAEGREPEGMDAATATLFPSSIEDSTLGPTPTGWTIGKVSDLGRVVCGKTPPTSNAHY
jgi:type I restriction enzyme S subunit